MTKGRTVSSLVAASVYLACREAEIPKTLDEISKAGSVSRKRLARDYRLLSRTFKDNLPVADLPRCVTKITNIVGVGELKKRRAVGLVDALTEIEVSAGKSPLGLAAAAIYLICKNTDEEKTQAALAQAAGITEVTIRNRCSELVRLLAAKKVPHFNPSLAAVAIASIEIAMVANAWGIYRPLYTSLLFHTTTSDSALLEKSSKSIYKSCISLLQALIIEYDLYPTQTSARKVLIQGTSSC